jgi:LysR family transcriptional regulator of abg operon
MKKSRPSLLQPRQLEAVVAVGRTGSVHAAARELHIPQPAVSRLVAAMEKTLGVTLFDRSRSGTHVTETGARVLKQAAFALRALESIAESAKSPQLVLRIGCIPRVTHIWLPHLLAHLDERSEHFRVQVFVGNSDELADQLENSKLDYVIGLRAASATAGAQTITEELYSEKTVVVCGRGNDALPKSAVPLSQLVGLSWVLPKQGAYSRDRLDSLTAKAGLPPIQPAIESTSFEASLSLVAGTRYLGIAPEFAALRFERLKLVRIVRTTPSLGSSPVLLQYRDGQQTHPAHADFWSAAMGAARKVRAR